MHDEKEKNKEKKKKRNKPEKNKGITNGAAFSLVRRIYKASNSCN
jgi:hypothetical protein